MLHPVHPIKTIKTGNFPHSTNFHIYLSPQGMIINGMVNVVISTLEKRFELKSVVTGQIAGFYDLGSLLAVIPITYFGGRMTASKPRSVTCFFKILIIHETSRGGVSVSVFPVIVFHG